MTREDYVAIAAAIRPIRAKYAGHPTHPNTSEIAALAAIDDLISSLAVALVEDNPRFDVCRFVAAIVPDEKGGK
jgi:hypothetical protein